MERLGKNWNGGIFVGTSSAIPNTNGMRNDVIDAFKEAGVGMIEWPGGCAAGSYNWSANKNPSNDVGTDRYMQLCQLLGIPPMIAGPGTSAAAANNLAWVQYINNNATHPEWTLNHFKIGNEVWGCGGNQDEATYEANYVANYNMLSAPVNGKKLSIVAGTDLIGKWPWLDTMLKNQAGKIDGVEIHDYIYHPDDIPNVGFTDAQYYNIVNAANKGQIGPRIDQAVILSRQVRSGQAHQDLRRRVGGLAAELHGQRRLAAAGHAHGRHLRRRRRCTCSCSTPIVTRWRGSRRASTSFIRSC